MCMCLIVTVNYAKIHNNRRERSIFHYGKHFKIAPSHKFRFNEENHDTNVFAAVSVSVGVWTLVAISLERYFAICRPLKSRRWQTQFHAYKMIALVWAASLTWNSPILVVSTLRALRGGEYVHRLFINIHNINNNNKNNDNSTKIHWISQKIIFF